MHAMMCGFASSPNCHATQLPTNRPLKNSWELFDDTHFLRANIHDLVNKNLAYHGTSELLSKVDVCLLHSNLA